MKVRLRLALHHLSLSSACGGGLEACLCGAPPASLRMHGMDSRGVLSRSPGGGAGQLQQPVAVKVPIHTFLHTWPPAHSPACRLGQLRWHQPRL